MTSDNDNTPTPAWIAIPAPPKVPNYWQGYGYTLRYKGPGWDVHAGTHSSKEALGEVLHHERAAAAAKTWAEEHPLEDAKPAEGEAKPKAARKRTPRKPKADAETVPDTSGDQPPAPDTTPDSTTPADGTPADPFYDGLLAGATAAEGEAEGDQSDHAAEDEDERARRRAHVKWLAAGHPDTFEEWLAAQDAVDTDA